MHLCCMLVAAKSSLRRRVYRCLPLENEYVPDLFRCFFFTAPLFGCNCITNLVRDTNASSARAENDKFHIFQMLAAHVKTSHDSRQSNTPRALDIVVEAGDLGAVLLQYAPGWSLSANSLGMLSSGAVFTVGESKVFKMDVSVWKKLAGSLNESVDEIVVPLASNPLLSQAQI